MPVTSCSPADLSAASRCFECIVPRYKPAVNSYLLAQIAGGSTDPKVLNAQSAAYKVYTKEQDWAAEVYLLALIAGGSTDPKTLFAAAKCFPCLDQSLDLENVTTYLLAVQAGGSTDPGTLLKASAQFMALSGMIYRVELYLILLWAQAHSVGVGVGLTPASLLAASKCFLCLSGPQLHQIRAYLLCSIGLTPAVPCVPELAPTQVVATSSFGGDPTAIGLTWNQPLNIPPVAPSSFTIMYGTTNGGPYPFSQTAPGGFGPYSATVTGLSALTTYYFIIFSNSNPPTPCASPASAQASATTPDNGTHFASGWADRVVANGGDRPGNTSINAYAALYDGLVTDSLLSSIKHLNGLAPDNITACRTPFIVGTGNDPWIARCGNNNLTTVDLTINGVAPSGGNSCTWDTGILDTVAFASDNDGGMTLYISSTVNEGVPDCGYGNDALTNIFSLLTNAGNLKVVNLRSQTSGALAPNVALNNGYFSMDRTAVNSFTLYFANSTNPHAALATTAVAESGVRQAQSFYFAGLHAIDHGAVCTGFATPNKRYSFFAIHNGFTAGQSALFFARIQTFRTSLGGGFI